MALIGIGTREDGPLLLVLSADVDAALDKAQVYHVEQVVAWAMMWTVGKPLADLIKAQTLRLAREQCRQARGGWLLMSGPEVDALIIEAAVGLGLETRVLAPARHDTMVLERAGRDVW